LSDLGDTHGRRSYTTVWDRAHEQVTQLRMLVMDGFLSQDERGYLKGAVRLGPTCSRPVVNGMSNVSWCGSLVAVGDELT